MPAQNSDTQDEKIDNLLEVFRQVKQELDIEEGDDSTLSFHYRHFRKFLMYGDIPAFLDLYGSFSAQEPDCFDHLFESIFRHAETETYSDFTDKFFEI